MVAPAEVPPDAQCCQRKVPMGPALAAQAQAPLDGGGCLGMHGVLPAQNKAPAGSLAAQEWVRLLLWVRKVQVPGPKHVFKD